MATEPGMSFDFIFYARILQVYGVVIPLPTGERPAAQYSMDGDPEINLVPNSTSDVQLNVPFYISTLLPLTFHTLTVKVTNASADAPFLFDYVVYGFLDASDDPDPPGSQSLSTSSSATTSTASSPSGVSTTLAPSDRPIDTPSKFPTIAVIGGVVGGIVFLLALGGAIYWCCTRSRRTVPADRESIEPASEPDPQPAVRSEKSPLPASVLDHRRAYAASMSTSAQTSSLSAWWAANRESGSYQAPASSLKDKSGGSDLNMGDGAGRGQAAGERSWASTMDAPSGEASARQTHVQGRNLEASPPAYVP
ncbi:hypothetical protein BD413DRAFT_612133 [Trametes elegans]|nr:hypothetical protein BD413DRAFT_612133 [Trametes elegans]